jgi:Ca2+-binding EF-hand superfamily protein
MDVWSWFKSVDRDNSGSINARELREALVNNNWSHFNEETCRILIGMFDSNKDGTIDVREFEALWKYVQEWRNCFERFDRDRSGKIDSSELHQALTEFGYRLSMNFCTLCTRVFDRNDKNSMNFDDFIQCCVMIKMLTDSFRKKDRNQSGVINISYEEVRFVCLDL